MSKNKNSCDCELCLFKTFPLDNPLVNNSNKIVESIIYHFIFRLGNLVKSRKELNLHVLKFIATINQSYLPYTPLKETIELLYKKIIGSGKGCHFSTNTTLTKLINKEAIYLKLIISSMEEVVLEIKVSEEDKFEEVVKPEEEVVKPEEEEVKPEEEEVIEVKPEEVVLEQKDITEPEPVLVSVPAPEPGSYCIIS